MTNSKLKIIPFYTGHSTLEDAISDKRTINILWLEILLNDSIDWPKIPNIIITKSYKKACIWYWNFKTIIDNLIKRKPLDFMEGKPDLREYRRFLEAINFVTD